MREKLACSHRIRDKLSFWNVLDYQVVFKELHINSNAFMCVLGNIFVCAYTEAGIVRFARMPGLNTESWNQHLSPQVWRQVVQRHRLVAHFT
jgi:hypothetical protein